MDEPDWDAAMTYEDDERHRAAHGYCLDTCDHPECHTTNDHDNTKRNEEDDDA
jgi:hypothetical protein